MTARGKGASVTLQVHPPGALRELQKDLKKMSEETPKVIQEAHKEVAGIVVREAQSNASSRLASRIKAFGTTRRAGVRFSGHRSRSASKTTDAFLQEFGGRAPLFGDKDHWFVVKPPRKGGYIVYPAIRDTRDEVVDTYLEKLDESIQRFWSRRGRL